MVGWLIDDEEKVYNLEDFFQWLQAILYWSLSSFLLLMMWINAQVLLEEHSLKSKYPINSHIQKKCSLQDTGQMRVIGTWFTTKYKSISNKKKYSYLAPTLFCPVFCLFCKPPVSIVRYYDILSLLPSFLKVTVTLNIQNKHHGLTTR